MTMSKKSKIAGVVGIIVGIIAILTFLFKIGDWIDCRYAHLTQFNVLAQEVKKESQRLDYKILSDQLFETQKRIYTIEERYPNKSKMPSTVKEELDQQKKKEKKLEKKIEAIEEGGK